VLAGEGEKKRRKKKAKKERRKSKFGSILAKAAALRITLNIDGAPIVSQTHTHPSHSELLVY
jgi:hypothetical protein